MVVSSSFMITTILMHLVPEQYDGSAICNCSVTILKYKNGNFILESITD